LQRRHIRRVCQNSRIPATESQGKTKLNMSAPWHLLPLESLGALRARGRDASAFLHGQLSADVTRLTAGGSLLAGYHNPQGRVLAVLRLMALAPEDVLAILPRELVSAVTSRLAAFVLRSKVALADDSAAWHVAGLVGPAGGAAAGDPPPVHRLPEAPGAVAHIGATAAVHVGTARWLLVTPATEVHGGAPAGFAGCLRADPGLWRRLAIESGEPQVYAATSGEFVAQMLNLDALGAIAFDKGCYTGQEVIARAHYRGRVKRRLQRFRSPDAPALAPGDAGELGDGRAFRVVDAVRLEEGGCEFLAVAPLAAGATAGEGPAAGGTLRLEATQLPLPYELPE
jgi:tRNA-modifying protein YgfZ